MWEQTSLSGFVYILLIFVAMVASHQSNVKILNTYKPLYEEIGLVGNYGLT